VVGENSTVERRPRVNGWKFGSTSHCIGYFRARMKRILRKGRNLELKKKKTEKGHQIDIRENYPHRGGRKSKPRGMKGHRGYAPRTAQQVKDR